MAELDERKNQNGRSTRSRLIQKLLRDSITRENRRVSLNFMSKAKKRCASALKFWESILKQ